MSRFHNDMQRVQASIALLPGLLAERAVLLTIQGHVSEAQAEVDLLAETYPSYPLLHAARFRVSLMIAAHRGDVAAAAALADATADLPIGPRDELLLDLARAARNPGSAGAGEIERLKETLQIDKASRRWLDIVGPALVTAFLEATREPQLYDGQLAAP